MFELSWKWMHSRKIKSLVKVEKIYGFALLLASASVRAMVYILFLNSKMPISVKGTIDLTSAFLGKNRNGWQVSFKIHCRMLPNLRHVKM